jgi:hypothetical protein
VPGAADGLRYGGDTDEGVRLPAGILAAELLASRLRIDQE